MSAQKTSAHKTPPRKGELSKPELEKQLSRALKDTFPASDPITVGQPTSTEPDRPAHRRAPLIDKDLVNELAAKAGAKSRKAH